MARHGAELTVPTSREQDALVRSTLAKLVVSRYLGTASSELRAGPLQRNNFSLLFTLEDREGAGYVVKVPKTDLRLRPEDGLFPITAGDRALGRSEFDSLELMTHSWQGKDVRVSWVKPVAYVQEYNAVITERVDAVEACSPYRRLVLRQLVGDRTAGAVLMDSLSRIGTALGRFHDTHSSPVEIDGSALARRLSDYIQRLDSAGANLPPAAPTDQALDRLAHARWAALETMTLKGIDIRNVLVAPDGRIWLVDPGRTKRAAREADLSRFLLTWRILFWGSPWFFLRLSPHACTEAAFLRAYYAGRKREESLLNAFLLKEALKHWLTAYDSLALKSWSSRIRDLVRHSYIDPFYRQQMRQTLHSLV